MLIRCINRPFRDLKAKCLRGIGDEWEADASRLAEINRAGYGVMAEAVEGAGTPAEAEGGAKPAKTAKRAAEPARAPQAPTAEELEGMTVRQLVELCVLERVETPSKPRKDELVSALKSHYGLE